MKLGQMCSNRTDIFPPELIAELQKLQDEVEPENIDIREKIRNELNIDAADYFEEIGETPIASASMGQVYKGMLKGREEVAIKVKRESIRDIIMVDLSLMKDLAAYLEARREEFKKMNILHIVNTFANSTVKELSFRNELKNMEKFAHNFRNNGKIHVPAAYRDLSNDNLLCMEFIRGAKISDREKIIEYGFIPENVAKAGLNLYIQQVLKYGFFHADPHPGNIFIQKDGKIVFIDFGGMGTLYPQDKEILETLLVNFIQKDTRKIIASFKELAESSNIPDERKLERELSGIIELVDGSALSEISLGDIFEKVKVILNENQVLLPEDIYLLAKGIGQIEGIGRHLDPNLDITEVMTPYADRIIRERLNPKYILEKSGRRITEISENWISLPEDLKNISQKILNGELKHRHEVIGFDKIQKTLDRLVESIVVAALLVGSSILVLADMPPKIHGVSALGFTGFVLAGILVVLDIFRQKKWK